MEPAIYFVLGGAGTVVSTIVLIRWRLARKGRIGFGTTLLGALCGMIVVSVAALAGNGLNGRAMERPIMLLVVSGYVFAACLVPAMAIVIFYQGRGRRER